MGIREGSGVARAPERTGSESRFNRSRGRKAKPCCLLGLQEKMSAQVDPQVLRYSRIARAVHLRNPRRRGAPGSKMDDSETATVIQHEGVLPECECRLHSLKSLACPLACEDVITKGGTAHNDTLAACRHPIATQGLLTRKWMADACLLTSQVDPEVACKGHWTE